MENKIKKRKRRRKDAKHYVDNKEFYIAIKEHIYAVREAQENEEDLPRPSDYIGECLMKMAQGMANLPNFSGYPFKEDMIYDGVENALRYLNNFDPDKYDKPYSYYNMIIFNSFRRKINKEKAALYTKYKKIEHIMLHDIHEEDKVFMTQYGSDYSDEYMNNYIAEFEEKNNLNKKRAKKKPKNTNTLEIYQEDDE